MLDCIHCVNKNNLNDKRNFVCRKIASLVLVLTLGLCLFLCGGMWKMYLFLVGGGGVSPFFFAGRGPVRMFLGEKNGTISKYFWIKMDKKGPARAQCVLFCLKIIYNRKNY